MNKEIGDLSLKHSSFLLKNYLLNIFYELLTERTAKFKTKSLIENIVFEKSKIKHQIVILDHDLYLKTS